MTISRLGTALLQSVLRPALSHDAGRFSTLTAWTSLVLVTAAGALAREPEKQPDRPHVVGYLASWNATPERIAAIRGEHLTHLIYAFGAVTADGRASIDDCTSEMDCLNDHALRSKLAALATLKRRHSHLRVLVALGGWTSSTYFSDAAATPETRRRLADSAVDLFMRRLGDVFDGIDIDWEFPVEGGRPETITRPDDRENLTKLMKEIRIRLDALGHPPDRRPLLALATSASRNLIRNLELLELARIVDWIGIMAYDYHAGARVAGFNAPLYSTSGDPNRDISVDATVQAYLAAGAPPRSLVLGVPFYGRAYGKVEPGPREDGLLQEADPSDTAEWDVSGIPSRVLTARAADLLGFQRHWHDRAQVPWLYNPRTRVWISYEDSRSIALKGAYARLRDMRGVMAWELGGDDGTLLQALDEGVSKFWTLGQSNRAGPAPAVGEVAR
jgi:chitinase